MENKQNQTVQGCTRESGYDWSMGKSPKQQVTCIQLGHNAHPAWQPKVRISTGCGNMGITGRDTTPVSLHCVFAAFQASCTAIWTSLKAFQSSSQHFEYSAMLALVVLSWVSLSEIGQVLMVRVDLEPLISVRTYL